MEIDFHSKQVETNKMIQFKEKICRKKRLKNDIVDYIRQVKLNEIGKVSNKNVKKFNILVRFSVFFECVARKNARVIYIELASGPNKIHVINKMN